MVNKKLKPVAIVGSTRIPFCRAYSGYMDETNLSMMSGALRGLASKFALKGQHIDEVIGGVVLNHARDFNIAREAALNAGFAPTTPGTTLQIACGTSLQAALVIGAKIATGEIDSGIACGSDSISDCPIVFSPKFSKRMIKLNRMKTLGQKLGVFKGFGFGEIIPNAPSTAEPRTGLSMGQHCELMAREWNISRKEQDDLALQSHLNAAKSYQDGFHDDLIVPHAGIVRDNNIRSESTAEDLAKLKPSFDRKSGYGTLTPGNSTPLTDGAAAVLLASEEWAHERGLPILGFLRAGRVSANDFAAGDGLLMAPTIAISNMLARNNLSFDDFDMFELHEAFAAQVLATMKSFEDQAYNRTILGRDTPLGAIDRNNLNLVGSSLAYGHPFAATGARILGVTAKLLHHAHRKRALISVCTAGGQGVAAIIERA